jgi:hypothetical protein
MGLPKWIEFPQDSVYNSFAEMSIKTIFYGEIILRMQEKSSLLRSIGGKTKKRSESA